MATTPNTNLNIPYSAFLDPTTGRPTQAWLLWLMSPNFITANFSNALPVASGGTGLSTIPTNGQLLIGDGTGYTLNTLSVGNGISVTNAAGSITVANTGVLSFTGGTTGLTPSTATTGNVVLSGTLNAVNGGTGQSSYAVGDILYANSTTTLTKLAKPSADALLKMTSSGVPSWKIPRYGSFYDTTAQTAAANTPTAITYNTTQFSDGISIGSPTSRVVIGTAGLYNIQFSIQFTNSSASLDDAAVWLRVNGTDVSNSASWVATPQKHGGTNGQIIMALNLFYQFNANDYFELIWMTVGGTTSIETIAGSSGTPAYPASPSVILTVSDNIAA